MAPIAKLFVEVGSNISGFQKGMNTVNNEMHKSTNFFTKSLASIGSTVKYGSMAAVAGFTAIGGAVAKTGFEFDAFQESALTAFETMLGSGQKAKEFVADLTKFARDTPFELEGLTATSQKLLAFGFEADRIFPLLTNIGDAVSGLGGSPELLNRITIALGQIKAKGKVQAEEMLQLTEAGIPAWQMLADKIGVTIPEAMKMVTKGMVDSETAIGALTAGMDAQFGGLMEKQSKSWNGMLSTFKDYFAQISGKVMAPFFEFASKGLARILEMMETPQFDAFIANFISFVENATPKVINFISQIFAYGKKFSDWISGLDILKPSNSIVTSLGSIGKSFSDLVAALVVLFPNWDSNLGKFLSVTLTVVGGLLKTIVDGVDLFIKNLTSFVKILTAIKDGDWTTVWNEFLNVGSNYFSFFNKAVENFTGQDWRERLTSFIRNILPEWSNLWSTFVNPITGLAETLTQALLPLSGMLGQMLVYPMKMALNSIIDLHNMMIQTVNNGLRFVPGAQMINIPLIPRFENGGIMQRTGMALVGEAGPELVRLGNGDRVYDHGQSMGMLGSKANSRHDIYIHNESKIPIDRTTVREIAVMLQRELNLQGNRVVFS